MNIFFAHMEFICLKLTLTQVDPALYSTLCTLCVLHKTMCTMCVRMSLKCFIITMCIFPVSNMTSVQLEEQFRCCICLEIYTDPVSIPCGHNFCLDCIEDYWDTKVQCECPLCKEIFPRRPELRINHAFADIIEFLKRFVFNTILIRIL